MPRVPYDTELLQITRLEVAHDVSDFDCGDMDLNAFLKDDAASMDAQILTSTYIAIYQGKVVGYISVITDVLKTTPDEKTAMKLQGRPHKNVPALKIARLGVHKAHAAKISGIGTALVRLAFDLAVNMSQYVGCRLLTVDSLQQSIGFYKALGFVPNAESKKRTKTLSMRFDIRAEQLPKWAQHPPEETSERTASVAQPK